MNQDDDPHLIAIEQCLWWASNGLLPAEALSLLGVRWTSLRAPEWQVVAIAAELIWSRLPKPAAPDPRQPRLKLVG